MRIVYNKKAINAYRNNSNLVLNRKKHLNLIKTYKMGLKKNL
jgi:hypothetical protein